MKIAYLVNTYPRPSHSFIRREIHALERQGFEVHRFAMRSDRGTLVEAIDKAEDAKTEHVLEAGTFKLLMTMAKWKLFHLPSVLSATKLAFRMALKGRAGEPGTGGIVRHMIYLLEAAYIADRCTTLGIRHIHAHFGTNSTTVAMLASVLGKLTFSFTAHGPEEFDAPRAYGLGEKIARAAFTVGVSSFGRSQLSRWSDISDWPKIKVVHCGIEPSKFPPPSPLPEGGPHLVAIGRLCEQKGFPLLIEAMALAAPRLPNLHLTIVGDGELRGMIEAEIARLGLTNCITLAGWLDEAGVRAAIAASQALVLPSLAEGLPMVVMEAMASGRPCIATTIAGVPDLVVRSTGWLVPAGDPEAMAVAICDFAEMDTTTLAKMGEVARERALFRHDIDVEATRLADHFRRVVKA